MVKTVTNEDACKQQALHKAASAHFKLTSTTCFERVAGGISGCEPRLYGYPDTLVSCSYATDTPIRRFLADTPCTGFATGISGVIGVTGVITGVSSVAGVSGVTGVIGVAGISGVTGIIGVSGVIGISDVTGATGVICVINRRNQRKPQSAQPA